VFARALTSARLTLKVHRFEVAAMTVAAVVVAALALWVKARLDATGATQACLEQWLVQAGEPAEACRGPVQQWGNIVNGDAGKSMGAMLVAPFAVGLVLGVPIVGREIEQRTASTAWALAGSRRRWLGGRVWPFVLLVIFLGVIMAYGSSVLADARTAHGLWGSTFGDALFFGAPVIAHVLLGLGIGVVVGATVGRTLPALIVGAALALIVVAMLLAFQAGAGRPSLESPAPDFGVETGLARADVLDPDWDVYFTTADGQVLTLAEALATVPPGTDDVGGWLTSRYTVLTAQISEAVTLRFQVTEAVGVLVASGFLLLAAFPIVKRRRPG
jgi:hypothetical protein